MRISQRRRPGWVAAVLAGCLLMTPAVAAQPASAVADSAVTAVSREAYVWADQPTAPQYIASTGYEYHSTGGTIEITRTSVGAYAVRFGDLAGSGGVAHALAYGVGNSSLCAISSYRSSGRDLVVQVRCYDAAGEPADSQFVASFTDRQVTAVDAYFAYLFSDRARPVGPYRPAIAYDSTGEQVLVTRTGVGQYQVHLGSLDATWPGPYWDGFFTATAYSDSPVRCDVLDAFHFIPHDLPVRCHRPDGTPVDSRFTLTYANRVNVLGAPADHVSVMAKPQGAAAPFVVQWWGTAAKPTATRLGVGDYLVSFDTALAPFGHAVASLQGIMVAPQYCTIAAWFRFNGLNHVRVNCWEGDGSGQAADVWAFNVAFTT